MVNKMSSDILKQLYKNNKYTQRELSVKLQCSLGTINKNIKKLKECGYLLSNNHLTEKSALLIKENSPKNAIILAAGIGLRMTPINRNTSKGFIEINGKTIIQNIIEMLQHKGIKKIYIVVGYMKEQYEELIDRYGIHLIVNNRYMETNNIYSLYLAKKYINNSYILPSDMWFQLNPFSDIELNSWYLFDKNIKNKTNYIISKTGLIHYTEKDLIGSKPLSIAYLNNKDSETARILFENLSESAFTKKHYYWENIVIDSFKTEIYFQYMKGTSKEINTFQDLRELDPKSESLRTEIINIILDSLKIDIFDIKNIVLSKKGMTNRSFLFETSKNKYIMRIPGEGTDQLINRHEEGEVYKKINPLHICDEVIYFNETNGYKLTKFINDSRVCDPKNLNDLKICMKFLRRFHNLNIEVGHTFDIYEKIDFYENLRACDSLYRDYAQVKRRVFALRRIVDKLPKMWTLTHIDAIPDNFLICEQGVRLIDWEYAGMQDAHIDIAMFCIYAMYDKEHIDQLIDIYFENQCPNEIRLKIYCYIAACGLLWSNWCEYKHQLGVEFGEYSLAQYRFAKEYYYYAMNFMEEKKICIS